MQPNLIPFPQRSAERRRREEREFLPAALEIIETPVSAAGRIMMGVIVVLVGAAVAWACYGRLDIVATANGRLIPSGQIKLIQPFEISVVKRIMVADGDHVAAGDELIELDTQSIIQQQNLTIYTRRSDDRTVGAVVGFLRPDPTSTVAYRHARYIALTVVS